MGDLVTVAVVLLAIALAGILPLVGWLAYRGFRAADLLTAERIAHGKTTLRAERAELDRDAQHMRAEEAERIATALEEVLADVQANPNADLPAGDIVSRVRRAAAQAARDRDGAVRAGQGTAVHAAAATGGPDTAGVSAVVGIDDKLLAPSD